MLKPSSLHKEASMDNERSRSANSGSGAVTSAAADIAEEKTGLGAQAGAALSKVSEAAQQAGSARSGRLIFRLETTRRMHV
jgi:hypothetical protein